MFLLSVPQVTGDEWSCKLFPNFPESLKIDMKDGFCGRFKRSFPECDPQLPPDITYYSSPSDEIGTVDMKQDIESGENAVVIGQVNLQGK